MKVHKLPPEVTVLFHRLKVPPRLVAHLTLVHDVAATLVEELQKQWPDLSYDKQAMLIGAATHDFGKIIHTAELTKPGTFHEESGPTLLIENGVPEQYARFARTHGRWDQEPVTVEDLLVALADKIWRGQRNEKLEIAVSQRIAIATNQELWQVYAELDTILAAIAEQADQRLAWQARHPV